MPANVLDMLFDSIPIEKPYILDVGCGTGIVTRQLSERKAIVTGTDIDERMIKQANQHQNKHINYLVAPTEKLPLPDSQFDAVTAFSAFHWFANEQALEEIKRVLKSGGILFIANRNQVGEIREEYLDILRSYVQGPLPSAKENYNPAELLRTTNFSNVKEQIFPIVENLSIEHSLWYVQSTSLWNLIPDDQKNNALSSLKIFFEDRLDNGVIRRPIEIQVVMGVKI